MSPDRESWPGLRRVFRLPGGGRRVPREVDEELSFHFEERTEDLMALGLTREEAEAEVRRRFGDVSRIRAECETIDSGAHRERVWLESLDWLRRDVRFAFRGIATRPLVAAVIVATLALGIGANTAIFSVVDSVLLNPLPVRELDRLVVIQDDLPAIGLRNTQISPGEAIDLFQRRDLFESITAFSQPNRNLTGAGEPRRLAAVATLGEFFEVFGTRPYLGRLYGPDASWNDGHQVAVLSYGLWQEITGGDPRVIGTTLRLDDQPYEVIGVLPPEFRYPRTAQLWIPRQITRRMLLPEQRGTLTLTAVARLKAGVTMERLREQLLVEAKRWHERFKSGPFDPNSQSVLAVPFTEYLGGQLRPILVVLVGAVAFVLLIACANVASLQLVRATGRAKEIGIRTALGAGRGTIARQLLAESFVLAALGGLLGLGLGAGLVRFIAASDVGQFAMLRDVRLDAPVLLFTAAVTIVAALLFGTFPALRASRVDVNEVLKESGGRGSSGGPARSRFLQGAVVLQFALALVLLVGSTLVTRSLARLLESDPGFNAEQVVTMQLSLPGARYSGNATKLALHDELLERLRGAPGIQAAGTVYGLPFSSLDNSSPVKIAGRATGPDDPQPHANMWYVGGDYFRAMNIPLIKGRVFTDADVAHPEGEGVVSVIDETMARQYFPGEDPIGKQISQGPTSTIVGIVGSVKKSDLAAPDKATIYYSFRQTAWALSNMSVVVRTTLPTNPTVGLLRSAVAEIDRELPVFDVMTMEERVERSLGARRLAVGVLGGFAGLSLLLSVLGIYGVLSYGVSQRTHEIGVRLALGANPGDVVRMVLRHGLALAAAGLVVGSIVFLGVARGMGALLYGIGPRDPGTLAAGAAVLAAVAAAGCYLPARRAARVDPAEALRAE